MAPQPPIPVVKPVIAAPPPPQPPEFVQAQPEFEPDFDLDLPELAPAVEKAATTFAESQEAFVETDETEFAAEPVQSFAAEQEELEPLGWLARKPKWFLPAIIFGICIIGALAQIVYLAVTPRPTVDGRGLPIDERGRVIETAPDTTDEPTP